MIKLENMVILMDERNDNKEWIMNKEDAKELENKSENYTIEDIILLNWKHISSEEVETGYIEHKYTDEEGFEQTIIENLWISGQQQLSNFYLD